MVSCPIISLYRVENTKQIFLFLVARCWIDLHLTASPQRDASGCSRSITSFRKVKSNWNLLLICCRSETTRRRQQPLRTGSRQRQRRLWQNQIRVVCYLPHNEKSNRFLCSGILEEFNCARQLKPPQLLRFHSSSEKYSCSNPLINVCLGNVSMETVFTAPQCSKNGSILITAPDE